MHRLLKLSRGCLFPICKTHLGEPKVRNGTLVCFSHLCSLANIQGPISKSSLFDEAREPDSSEPMFRSARWVAKNEERFDQRGSMKENEAAFQIIHPWPEWVDLMECLLKSGYFEGDGNPFENGELGFKEANSIRTACLNFARDRYVLIRYLSRKDIQVIAGCGCPSIDRKVVNSGKRLRAHVGIDEGNVCSSCHLRGSCERAYVKAREEEGGRTVDVMRVLLTYGLDYIMSSVENKPCLSKIVKESVRRLLKEMVDYSSKELDNDLPAASFSRGDTPGHDHPSMQDYPKFPTKPGDWLCPKCDFQNFARNIRCLRCDALYQERLRQLQEDQDNLPLKKGDWICEKCNFLNFAKNTKCLLCKEKPPMRKLNPGEWECESCNYINFRRNMVCLKCDHRRPKASNASKLAAQSERENGRLGNRLGYRSLFGEIKANDCQTGVQDGQRQISRVSKWRFVEKEDESMPSSRKTDSKFASFPIIGGKSSLSQNEEMREKWKFKMSERSKSPPGSGENDDTRRDRQRKFELLESTDDEEMAEWFQHR